MAKRSTVRFLVAEIAGIGINAVGLGLWVYEDFRAEKTLLIYAAGAVSAVVFAALTVLLAVPDTAADGTSNRTSKWGDVGYFALVSLFVLGVIWSFIINFVFLAAERSIDLDAPSFAIPLAIMLGLQFAAFVTDVLTLRPMPLHWAEFYMFDRGWTRILVLFFAIFIGVILRDIFGEVWFAVPLFLFKALIDVAQPIRSFLRKDAVEPAKPYRNRRLLS